MRLLFAGLCLATFPALAQTYTPESFGAELDRLQASLETLTAGDLPPDWEVQTPDKRYRIPTERLREILNAREVPAKDVRVKNAGAYLAELKRQVAAPAQAGDRTSERRALEAILDRSEFAGVKPPSAWDEFQQRVLGWLRDLINDILAFAASHPGGSKALFWTLLVGGVAFLAFWLYRVWSRAQEQAPGHVAAGESPMSRTWQQWLQAAREAAGKGDSREAIRCAYWSGVARLQEEGRLPSRLSKTPRECLRLIGGAPREPLRALTTALERFWYAGHAAGASDVERSFRELEALGCKAD